ncbi:MAG TPA: TonB-dependent receptor, partial [Rhodothermales bacterium]
NVKLEYQILGNQIDRKRYSYGFRYNPDALRDQDEFSIVHGLDFTHTLSNSLFYTLSARQNYFDYSDYKYESVFDPRYFEAGAPQGSASYENGAIVQGVELGRFVQTTNALVFKASATNQIGNVHLAKVGLEAQSFDLKFGSPGQLVSTTVDGVQQLIARTDTIGAVVLNYTPVAGALYAQDRVEWRDLRVRAGLRLEYFDANSTIPSDLANPANSIEGAPESQPQSTSAKIVLAPRLGISFPILDRASMFFSYGHFYQMPELGIMFSNSDYSILEDLQFGAEEEKGVLGNPDLDPEFTVQYEFGFKSEIAPWLGVDLSLFYKDIRSLLGVEFVQTYTAASYGRYTNIDFGDVQGFTLSVDQRGPGNIRTTLDYTFQRAVGNSSDPRETFNRQAAGEDPRPRQVPFNWDQRNTFNGTITWFERNKHALTAIFRAGSGQPFTPSIGSVFGSELEPNSGRKNNWFLVDLRGEKFFRLAGLNLTSFVRVFNLFDEHFVNGFVFADTGSPYYSLTPAAQQNQLNNPSRFHEPRRIEIGFSFSGSL